VGQVGAGDLQIAGGQVVLRQIRHKSSLSSMFIVG
jgi:hypothetical protein